MSPRTSVLLNTLLVSISMLHVMAPGAVAQVYSLTFGIIPRPDITAFPVPVFKPTTAAKVIAVDIMPSHGATENADNGFAWFDVCNADLLHNPLAPVACGRMGSKGDKVEIGSRAFNGAADQDIYIRRGNSYIGRFHAGGLEVYGTVKAATFTN